MNKRLSIAAFIWGFSILLSRLIGLGREAVIGRTLGGGTQADVFWAAFIVPDFLNYLLAGGALSLVFIPIFSSYLARNEDARGYHVLTLIGNFLAVSLLLLTIAAFILMPKLVQILAPGFNQQQAEALIFLTRLILPAQFFHVLGGLFSAALQARDKHLVPALAPLLYTGSIVMFGLVFGKTYGAQAFAWGVLVGSFLGPFGLPLMMLYRLGFRWRFNFHFNHQDLRLYLWRSLPIMFGFSIIVVDDWLLRRFGSLLGTGAISSLQYAKTLIKVPMGVFGLATGVATFPTLTRFIAEQKPEQAYTLLTSAVKRMLVLAFMSQVILSVVGTQISQVIYGQKQVSMAQHLDIGNAMAVMSLGLWAWAAQTVVARGFYALGNTWLPTLLGTVVLVFMYPFYGKLSQHQGLLGLALASSCGVILYVVLLMFVLHHFFKGMRAFYLPFMLKMAVSAGIAIYAGLYLKPFFHNLSPFFLGFTVAIFSASVFIFLVLLLKVEEAWDIFRLIRRRLK